jgi:hypothetical protein
MVTNLMRKGKGVVTHFRMRVKALLDPHLTSHDDANSVDASQNLGSKSTQRGKVNAILEEAI